MNPVFVYLNNNAGKKLSIRKISQNTGLKKKPLFITFLKIRELDV